MSTKYKIKDQDKLYFLTFATVHWIDVFTRNIYRDILTDSLSFCIEKKGLKIHAWCIMTNHVHLIAGTEGLNKIEDIIRDFKKHTSKEIIKSIESNMQESRREWMLWMFKNAGKRNSNNTHYQFWIQDNHPIELSSNEMMDQKLNYIHDNPVQAGFVNEAENYLYSSARDYCGIRGLIKVCLIE